MLPMEKQGIEGNEVTKDTGGTEVKMSRGGQEVVSNTKLFLKEGRCAKRKILSA